MAWVKVLHLLFVIAWMAGVFYLPRIMVHYIEGITAGEDIRRLVTMANRLLAFATVMAVLALAFGTWLWLGWWLGTGNWIMAKLVLVLFLVAYHFQCFRYVQQMRKGGLIESSIYFRLFNEAALLLLVPILILVVVKPF